MIGAAGHDRTGTHATITGLRRNFLQLPSFPRLNVFCNNPAAVSLTESQAPSRLDVKLIALAFHWFANELYPVVRWELLSGLALAATISLAAWRTGVLSRGGALAATALGTGAVAAGWQWAWLLVAFFVSSSGLSVLSAARKAKRSESVLAKGGKRDAMQVLANGGLFVIVALVAKATQSDGWTTAAIGTLAAAAADTWGTELGMLSRGDPWSLTERRRVPAGSSGAVSWIGILATLAGALFIAGIATLLGWSTPVVVVGAIAGIFGAMLDTLLGAFVQAQWRCPRCGTKTERRLHSCGAITELVRGPAWMDNDAVNFLCTGMGAIAAVLLIS